MRRPAEMIRAQVSRLLRWDSTPFEVYGIAPAVPLALVLLIPACTFCGSPNYRAMQWLLPESAWGCLFALYVALGAMALHWRLSRLRRWLMLGGVVVWGGLLALLVSQHPSTTGWVYSVPFFACLMAYLQLGEARRGPP